MAINCIKCGNGIKTKGAKFCPFCGEAIAEKEELAGYTRGQFFSYTGDSEFNDFWEKVRNMSAEDALAWIRERPSISYVYRFFGQYSLRDGYRVKKFAKCINKNDIAYVSKFGKVTPKKYKLTMPLLGEIGEQAFFTEEECEDVIKQNIIKT